jgi:hypothetical protein
MFSFIKKIHSLTHTNARFGVIESLQFCTISMLKWMHIRTNHDLSLYAFITIPISFIFIYTFYFEYNSPDRCATAAVAIGRMH